MSPVLAGHFVAGPVKLLAAAKKVSAALQMKDATVITSETRGAPGSIQEYGLKF